MYENNSLKIIDPPCDKNYEDGLCDEYDGVEHRHVIHSDDDDYFYPTVYLEHS